MEGNWLQVVVDERTRSEPRNAIHAAMRANTLTLSSKYSSPSRSGAEPTGPTLRQPTPACPSPLHYPVQLAAGHSRHTRARGAASNSPCTTACSRHHSHATGRDTAAEWCRLVCQSLQRLTSQYPTHLAMPRCKRLMLRFPRRNRTGGSGREQSKTRTKPPPYTRSLACCTQAWPVIAYRGGSCNSGHFAPVASD